MEIQHNKVAVIIPVYKTEKYVEKTVMSVVNQKYKNIEIILVNDGSPDNSPKICDKLAEKYEFIRVIHKENGGLSSARNAGIANISNDTEYVFFLDSDDSVVPNAIKDMVEIAEVEKSSVVMPYKYLSINEEVNAVEKENLLFPKELCFENPNDFVVRTIMENCRGWRATGILYRAEIIVNNNCLFPLGRISEDIVFNLQFFSYISKISYYSKPTIKVLKRGGSISRSFQKGFEDAIYFIDGEARKYLERVGLDIETNQKYLDAMLCRNLVVYLFAIMSSRNEMDKETKIKYAKKVINDKRSRNVFRYKRSIPWFESKKTQLAIRALYALFRWKLDSFAILLLSFMA